jgi:hypothetical protein
LIAKGSHIAAVIQCGGLWFANGKFGVTWRLFQGVLKPKATMRGVCQIQLSGEDKDRMVNQALSAADDDDEDDEFGPTSNEVDDTDDDEAVKEEVAEVVRVAEPAKKKVVKKVVKKKE